MGLSEHIRQGAVLIRENVDISGQGIFSSNLGAAYIILAIEVDRECRIRLYDNVSSINNSSEQTRSFGDTPLSTNIALIADISMSSAGRYTTDPVLYAIPENTNTYETYINISDSTGDVTGSMFIYRIEDQNVSASENNIFYKTPNRRQIEFNGQSNVIIDAPKTYLMIDALSNTDSRIRIYGNRESLDLPAEISRSFDEAVMSSNTVILADMQLSSGVTTKLFPKIIGANIQTLSSNIELISSNRSAINGLSEIYYRLEPSSSTVTMNVYSLED